MSTETPKLLLISGARPNYMKVAPLVWELRDLNRWIPGACEFQLVHTGQHYDPQLFDIFFADLDLPPPTYNLAVGSNSHAIQTAEIMTRFEPVLLKERPDVVVVVGDVNSTLACALTAVKLNVPVAHVEAGLRSFDRTMPEEINRVVTDAISSYLFTTERTANENLLREGIPAHQIFFVGNVMIDTLLRLRRARRAPSAADRPRDPLSRYGILTLHRPSSVDDPETLRRILAALDEVARNVPILFPCHPRTLKQIQTSGLEGFFAADGAAWDRGLHLLEPMGYREFLSLMAGALFVLTDSGGIQEETTVLGIPCVTLRENTERPVTVTEGTNVIVGTDPARIIEATRAAVGPGRPPARIPELWDGNAAARIVGILTGRHSAVAQAPTTTGNPRP